MNVVKSKRKRFEDVASKRVQYIIGKLELLGNCSNRNNYDYNAEDVKKMFSVIKDQLKKTETKFNDQLSKKLKSKFEF